MYCKWCGMESRGAEICEWCGKQLSRADGNATGRVRSAAAHDRSAATTAPPRPAASAAETLHIATVALDGNQARLARADLPFTFRLEKCMAFVLPLLAVSMAVCHSAPEALPYLSLLDLFVVSALLPLSGVVGFFEEEYADVGAVLTMCYLFGPAIALGSYLILAAFRQEINAAIPALLGAHFAVRALLSTAINGIAGGISLMTVAEYGIFLQLFAVGMTFGGWFLSSFFRPLNR